MPFSQRLFRRAFILYFVFLGILNVSFAKFPLVPTAIPLLPTETLIGIWGIYRITSFLSGSPQPLVQGRIASWAFWGWASVLFATSFRDLYGLRQYMAFAYVVLSFVSYDYFQQIEDFELVHKLTKVICAIAFFLTVINFFFPGMKLAQADQTSTYGVYYNSVGAYGAFFLLFFLSIKDLMIGRKFAYLWIAMVTIWLLFFALHRSAILALVIPLLIYGRGMLLQNVQRFARMFLLLAFAFLAVNITASFLGGSGTTESGIVNRLTSILHPGGDPNAEWRMHYWSETISEVFSEPKIEILGSGFWVTPLETKNSRLGEATVLDAPIKGFHSSFVFVLYKTGFVGLLLLLTIVTQGIWRSVRTIDFDLNVYGMAFVSVAIFAMFNVVLENPYNGFYFWFFLGAIYAKNEKLFQAYSNQYIESAWAQ